MSTPAIRAIVFLCLALRTTNREQRSLSICSLFLLLALILPLPLLVLGRAATNHPYHTFALDHPAIFAAWLDRRMHLHPKPPLSRAELSYPRRRAASYNSFSPCATRGSPDSRRDIPAANPVLWNKHTHTPPHLVGGQRS